VYTEEEDEHNEDSGNYGNHQNVRAHSDVVLAIGPAEPCQWEVTVTAYVVRVVGDPVQGREAPDKACVEAAVVELVRLQSNLAALVTAFLLLSQLPCACLFERNLINFD
jgi:hypothetical protein